MKPTARKYRRPSGARSASPNSDSPEGVSTSTPWVSYPRLIRPPLRHKQESTPAAENNSLPLVLCEEIALEVTFELVPDDLWQYALYHRRQKTMLRTILLYGFAVLIGATCATGFWGIRQAASRYHTLDWAGLLLLTFMAFCVPRIWPPTKKRLVKLQPQQPDLIGPHRVSIDQSWFFEETSAREIKYTWRSFESIEENQRYFFLFLSRNVAFIIPKRAFTSPNEAQAFIDAARYYFEAAKTRMPVTAEEAAVWPPAPRPRA